MRAKRGMATDVGLVEHVHEPEAPRIVEDDGHAGGHRKHHVIVLGGRVARVIEVAGEIGFIRAFLNAKGPGHAKVHDEHLSRRELGEQVFATAIERPHGPANQARREIRREGLPQIGSSRDDRNESGAFHDRLQLASHRFHFRELRHLPIFRRDRMQSKRARAPGQLRVAAACWNSP